MNNASRFNTITTGLAMFSMFFGAGNVVFPLALGQYAQDNNIYAILGLLFTAVGVPFAGLIAMTLFQGNYQHFFARMGNGPGVIITAIIMALIGPFGAIPRCIALSYSTASSFISSISLPIFSIISCLLIFAFTIRRNNIVDILGYILTPFLLISLGIIIVKGLIYSPSAPTSPIPAFKVFMEGLKQGYQTMDLLGAFFFSSVVLVCLRKDLPAEQMNNTPLLLRLTLNASYIGAALLSLVYVGFSYLAAFHSEQLVGVQTDTLISKIAQIVLGEQAGVIVCIAVALACLTTAIALAAVFAEYMHEDITCFKVGYSTCLIATLICTYFISTLNFTVIIAKLAPVLKVCYPALIVLSFFNILNKVFHVKMIRTPVYAVFLSSVIYYLIVG
ncbi:MAG: branched-chain amino acid transport system II carrier protein [Parachlamydiaceae bacterium]